MRPVFGSLNATIAKTIAENSPKKYRRIIEPFGDGGTYAFHVGHKPPKEHVLNIVDEELFAAMTAVKNLSGTDRSKLKKMDWIASQETFDSVMGITATEGVDALYKYIYVSKFGMQMDKELPPEFDTFSAGKDGSSHLYALPMMKAQLKRVTITNDDPFTHLSGGADDFFILLPKGREQSGDMESRLSGVPGNVFFSYMPAGGDMGVIDAAKKYSDRNVSALGVATIMVMTNAVVTNYESKLKPIDPDGTMKDH